MDNPPEVFQQFQRRADEAKIRLPLNIERHRQIEAREMAQNMVSLIQAVKEGLLPVDSVAYLLSEYYSLLTTKGLIDKITSVWNREGLEKIFKIMKSGFESTGNPLVIAMVDIDYFKQFNDKYDHETGDEVLIEFAQLIGNSLRISDTIARTGGEEFVVILNNIGEDGGMTILDRLRNTIATQLASKIKRVNIPEPITASIGYTVVKMDDSLKSALERADTAMYVAKGVRKSDLVQGTGRNRVIAYKPEFPSVKK